MAPLTPAQCASQAASTTNITAAMRTHRANTPTIKRPVHPGRTLKEAGFSAAERKWLLGGVCKGLAEQTVRGERIANWVFVALMLLLLLVIGAGVVNDRWADKKQVQTVEAGR